MEISNVCQECGCHCDSCVNNNSIHLHKEIEDLKKQLFEREYHIVQMETNVLLEADKYRNGEYFALRDEISHWQEKYERLYESHKRLQKVNQGLEDKLLKIVDKYETEKSNLSKDVTELTTKLVEARVTIAELEEENDRYRNDCNIAVQLLQCKPSHFVSHKVDSLPVDLQQKVKTHLNQKRRELTNNQVNQAPPDVRTIRVPIPTFPPTAMVYSVNTKVVHQTNGNSEEKMNGKNQDLVSAAIMAKVLEERAKERNFQKQKCLCQCKCKSRKDFNFIDRSTQTQYSYQTEAMDHDFGCSRNTSIFNTAVNSRTRTDSTSSFEQASLRSWSRPASTSSSTETQI